MMIKHKRALVASFILMASTAAITSASAATAAKVGAVCTTPGATAMVSGKTLVCSPKAIGSKVYTWTASTLGSMPSVNGKKPSITGGGDGGPGDGHGFGDGPNSAAFKAFQACLTKAGVTMPRRGGPDDGVTTPPTFTAAQQAAIAACQKANPSVHFGGPDGDHHGFPGGPRQNGMNNSGTNAGSGSTTTSSTKQ